MKYDATKIEDVHALALELLSVPEGSKFAVAAGLVEVKAMRIDLWTRFCRWVCMKRHKLDRYTALAYLFNQVPRAAQLMIEDAAYHMTKGKEKYGLGAGGFNQTEISDIALLVWAAHEKKDW